MVFLPLTGKAQPTEGEYYVSNFSIEEYKQAPQNFAITKGINDWLFAGNANGVMVYYGNYWKTFLVNNRSEVHSLFTDSVTNRVYVGAQGEIGYLAFDSVTHQLTYKSLMNVLGAKVPDFHDVYHIYRVKETLVFQANSGLFLLKDSQFSFIPLLVNQSRTFLVGKKLYVAQEGKSVSQLVDGKLIPIAWPYLNNKILGIIHFDDHEYWLTQNDGFYVRNVAEFERLPTTIDSLLTIQNSFLFKLANNQMAVASQRSGLLILNKDGKLLSWYQQKDGLANNTIWAIYQSSEGGNIYVATNNGISRIEVRSAFNKYSFEGQFYTVERFNNVLYAAGSSGVYSLSLEKGGGFKPLQNLQERAWYVKKITTDKDSILLISTNNGLYQYKGKSQLKQLIKDIRCWYILPLKQFPGHVLVNSSEGFLLLKQQGDSYTLDRKLKTPKHSYYYFVEDKEGSIWCNSPTTGIFRFKFSSGLGGQLDYEQFSVQDGLPSYINNVPFYVDEQLYVGTLKGVYQWSEQLERFQPDSIMNKRIGADRNTQVVRLEKDNYGRLYYVLAKNEEDGLHHIVGYSKKDTSGGYECIQQPFNQVNNLVVNDFLSISRTEVLLASGAGILKFKLYSGTEPTGPSVFLQKITATKPDSIAWFNQQPTDKITLPHVSGKYIFEFGVLEPAAVNTIQYQYRLAGEVGKTWSDWTVNNTQEYSALDHGNYRLEVRAKDALNRIGKPFAIHFEILMPWYLSYWAFMLYAIGLALVIWLVSFLYNFRLRNRTNWLETIINERTSEIRRRNQEIEIKNNQLEDKSKEIASQAATLEGKNKALEDAQLTIARQLDDLKSINTKLEEKVKARTSELEQAYKDLLILKTELDTFIYKSSHDINGPLMRLKGLCQVAETSVKSPEAKQYVDLLCNETEKAIAILRKLLVFYEVKNAQPNLAWLSWHDIKQEVEEFIESRGLANNLDLAWQLAPEVSYLITDKYLLSITLCQLIENAVFYRQGDKARVEIFAEPEANHKLILLIKDNGIGIPKSAENKVFEMFFRASARSAGPGMGLYTARSALQLLGGSITYKPEAPVTSFVIDLPTRFSQHSPEKMVTINK